MNQINGNKPSKLPKSGKPVTEEPIEPVLPPWVEREINIIKQYGKSIDTKEKAFDSLYRAGIVNKKGKLKKEYGGKE